MKYLNKLKFVFVGWLLSHLLTFVGVRLEVMTFRWCEEHNHVPVGQISNCAAEFYNTWYLTGKALQFNPVSHLVYYFYNN
jgi:hypothetical protein